MKILNNIPNDIVLYILSYDERFTVQNGKAYLRSFKKRHEHVIRLIKKNYSMYHSRDTSRYPNRVVTDYRYSEGGIRVYRFVYDSDCE